MALTTTAPVQRSFDDLGEPLFDVTFCVLDLETTGGSPAACEITEVGAVLVRGGTMLGRFQTLVNPGVPIPPEITYLTGITEALVAPAPMIDSVFPSLLEFIGDAVIVGHNIRFDLSFLNAAAARLGYPKLANRSVDTCGLARRLVRDEVPNCKLDTLASRLRLDHRPSHRALDDAMATTDLLHVLLERCGTLGVSGLDDLLNLPRIEGHAQSGKLRLTAHLPRSAGVYLFRDRHDRPLYIGKATNLRARVRSYFSNDDRRKIGQLLRETDKIDHVVCANALHAEVLETRLIRRLQPRFNRRAKSASAACYVKLTNERFARLSIVRDVRDDGAVYLGPLSSRRTAQLVIDAVHTVVPLRRCTARVPASGLVPGRPPCLPAQLGVSLCPCGGGIDAAAYAEAVADAAAALRGEGPVFDVLTRRMHELAEAERFEEAADCRDRADALATAVHRHRRLAGLVAAGTVRLRLADGSGVELDRGVLTRVHDADGVASAVPHAEPPPADRLLPSELADEVLAVSRFLDRYADRLRVEHAQHGLASVLPRLPTFAPAPSNAPAAVDRRR